MTLLNGDRITGEIKNLKLGRLELKTDDAGTIDVEWDKIASVEAARGFEVETVDGRRILGSFARTVDRRTVQIAGSDGVVSLAMADVTRIAPIGASFWRKLDGSFDAGFTYSQSSGIAQTTLNSNTQFRRPSFVIRLVGSATLTSQPDETERDDRGSVELEYARYRGRRWFVSGGARFDSNESLGLRLRSQVSGVLGLRVVNTNRAQLELGAGLVINDERAFDAPPSQNVEGVLALQTSYYTYDRPKTNFDTNFRYYPSLNNLGRQRVQLDTAVKQELLKDFFVALHLSDSFDSAPPKPGAARNDVSVSFSIGWSF